MGKTKSLIQYRYKRNDSYWMDYLPKYMEPPSYHLYTEEYKINGKIYTEYNDTFLKAFRQARTWEKLTT